MKTSKAVMHLAMAIALSCVTACTESPSLQPDLNPTPNLFAELLGKSADEIDQRVDSAFQQLFHGDPKGERVYFPVDEDMAYIWDVASDDVRSEGMSYGMMIAVQLDEKEVFDRLWKWTFTHMRIHEGDFEGYYNWQNATTGEKLLPGSASDGEEWFAMALFFASNRWGDGEGIFDYRHYANDILHHMLHKEAEDPKIVSIFDYEHKIVRFVPWTDWDGVSDPSYHVPAFYELWARWAEADNEYWSQVAEVSRDHFKEVSHPKTGLMPDYSYYKPTDRDIGDHKDFRFDAWRVISNVALDHVWWTKDAEWQVLQSNRILSFLSQYRPDIPSNFSVDGKPLVDFSSPGLTAMAATGGLAADPSIAKPFVEDLWNQSTPTGPYRYYDGLIQMLALLQCSGKFEVIQ